MQRVGLTLLMCWASLSCAPEGAAEGDGGVAGACVEADLVAQCPLGSNPLVGAQTESACEAAAGGIVTNGAGEASGQCQGSGACRVLCQFAAPCRCGVAQVSRAGVVCASCAGAAACGNGICEGGEDPQACPQDCGVECVPDERRCMGSALQACNLRGRWDTLPCPTGEVCGEAPAGARCVRDPGVIVGGDAGLPDGGAPPEGGRVVPGPGAWPAVADARRGETPEGGYLTEDFFIRLDDGSVNHRPTAFANAQAEVGGCIEIRLVPGSALVECLGHTGRFQADFAGEVRLPHFPIEVDEARFCADVERCGREGVPDCAALVAAQRDALGDTRFRCIYETIGESCLALATLNCTDTWRQPYPGDVAFVRNTVTRSGERLVGIEANQRTGVLVDLAAGTQVTQERVGAFDPTRTALSWDGRVAALVARQEQDEVIILWQPEIGSRRPLLPLSVGSTDRLALGPDGQVLAVRRAGTNDPAVDNAVALYNLAEEQRIFSIRPAMGDHFGEMAFSPDGRHLALAVQPNNRIELWDLVAQEKTQVLDGDGDNPLVAFAFSPDGRYLAANHERVAYPLHLWAVASGRRVQTVQPQQSARGPLVFEPDGARALISGGLAGRLDFTLLQR